MSQKSKFADLKSGVVVFLVALPLCLGIALACGVPLFSGIIAGVVGGILVTTFSGSKYSVSGPAAGLTAIVIAAISQLGSFEAFLAAVVFAGVFQIILGIMKAGTIGNYIPNAVIKGMLAGIGIILIIKQIPHLFGYDKDPQGDEQFVQIDGENSFTELVNMINYITPGAVVIALVSFAVLFIADMPFYKKNKVLVNIPGPLLAVVFGVLLTVIFRGMPSFAIDQQHLVNLPVINSFTDLQNNLFFPDFSFAKTSAFWVVVATLAIVASLETLLGIEAIDKLDPDKNESNTNKELMAQGIGNIVCGLVGGLPVTSVIVRSSANINAGAQSKASTIIHAVLLLISVLLLPGLLALIPNACLAAILIMTGFKLTKVAIFKEQWKFGTEQFIPFVVTIVVMLVTDLLKGVCAGVIISIIFIIRDNIKFSFESSTEEMDGKRYYLLKLPQQVTFFNKGYLIKFFKSISNDSKVIIDGSINKSINRDAKDVIADFVTNSKKKKIEVEFFKYHK
ncbi:MAG: sulfate transporter family protein [Bacteroidota bacterium]|jgi:MFS superfamily sulfate permease-like transporter|nr:sulfate transporter family protein [Bacteroidota bacterium]